MNVRDIAERCEAKLYAFRKSKDSMVVSFVLHPADVPEGLQLAPIGQRYVLAFCALNDDETPKEVVPSADKHPGPIETSPAPAIGPEPGRARTKKKWDEKSPAEQAGILSSSPAFWTFLTEERSEPKGCDERAAASWIRWRCGVNSRADIKPGTEAAEILASEVIDYRIWQHAQDCTHGAAIIGEVT